MRGAQKEPRLSTPALIHLNCNDPYCVLQKDFKEPYYLALCTSTCQVSQNGESSSGPALATGILFLIISVASSTSFRLIWSMVFPSKTDRKSSVALTSSG